MKARPITIAKDGDSYIARVPLARSGKVEALVKPEDYNTLLSLGVSPNWQISGGSVVANTPNGQTLVGRILTNAKAGQRVTYKDGNPLNLRRSNLEVIHRGFSLRNDFEDLVADIEAA
jgi:hypothetical protein